MAPLGLMSEGEKGEVAEIVETKGHCEGSKKHHCHMEDMGIRVGKEVEMLNNKGCGPLLIKVDETRIAIGRGAAMKIMVRRKN